MIVRIEQLLVYEVMVLSSYDATSSDKGEQVETTVKWFNLTKGFGFVAPADGTADAFMHASSLKAVGVEQVPEGTKLLAEIGDGPKGRQVLRIIRIISMGQGQRDGHRAAYQHQATFGNTDKIAGTVKWYKTDKGFGFVEAEDGGKDIFVHRSVVEGARMSQLEQGQRLVMTVHTTAKGREAITIETSF